MRKPGRPARGARSGGRRAAATGVAALACLALAPAPASAQAPPDVALDVGGQVRPRLEARDPAAPGAATFTSMRTRLSLLARLAGPVSAFVQLQDVRFWGEETGTLADFRADALDLHQGWVQLGDRTTPAEVRLGRQEVVYGGQRLVGAVDWTQQARAFDGVRARWRPAGAPGTAGASSWIDVFAFRTGESAAALVERDASFLGAWGQLELARSRAGRELSPGSLALFGMWDRRAGDAAFGDTDEVTLGGRWLSSAGPLDGRVEAAWQGGERAGADVDAWLLAIRAGLPVAEGRVEVWYDHLSGSEPGAGDGVGVFNTLYATNHKFYGYADLFLDIPAHTAGRGLRDLALKTTWRPAPDWTLQVDAHHFRVAEPEGLDSGRLGEELDVTAGWAFAAGTRLSAGLSYVLAGEALGPVRGIDGDVTFGYVMVDVVF